MIKIISVVGARPNFMKVAPLDREFAKHKDIIQHLIVHTGQHYDEKMSDAFFSDLQMPQPSFFLGVGSGTHAEQTAKVMIAFEKICESEKPDLVIVVGDVNSTLACSIVAVKAGIKLAHIESGLRSFDRDMPEEINRMVTDSIADFLFVTEKSGTENLLKEGHSDTKIFFCGNTMIDSLHFAKEQATKSSVLSKLGVSANEYSLITLHRPSNVDDKTQLSELLKILVEHSTDTKFVFPIHPRTRKNIELFGLNSLIEKNQNIILCDPMGYVEFLCVMMNSKFVMTDSGGIQEETTALKVPCLTLRTTTERPITCEIGTNILVNPAPEDINNAMKSALTNPKTVSEVPPLWDGRAAERIIKKIIELMSNKYEN